MQATLPSVAVIAGFMLASWMETIIVIGIVLVAFFLWEIKRAVERPQRLEEAKRRRQIEHEEWLKRRA